MTNRLAQETSPYLRQHQHNPVDWWPWNAQSLDQARRLNKPILLSIGYAACHWCHVMAHESFESPAIAEMMNRYFICIKVDREERPDLDAIYQQALSLMGQQGGWPLTMFLTPLAQPFYGGTYFPPKARYGRPAFSEILQAIAQAWADQGNLVMQNVARLTQALTEKSRLPSPSPLSDQSIAQALERILTLVDRQDGGLQGAPKFPQPALFQALWQGSLVLPNPSMGQAVITTLLHLCKGGIYDHLAGGFARYSTDESWLVPHFEKMLYDNAQVIDLLTLVWPRHPDPLFADRVAQTIQWLAEEMMVEDGAFAASLDADSEGQEGRFYVWSKAEIQDVLEQDSDWFCVLHDVSRIGNWDGCNILHRNHPAGEKIPLGDLSKAYARLKLARAERTRPGRDNKVLADWNGLMIAALARAAITFDRPDWMDMALACFSFIQMNMTLDDGRIAHCLTDGTNRQDGFIEDLAAMALAALALYECTGQNDHLDQALAWAESAHRHYWDRDEGGYFHAPHHATDLILRTKPIQDHAVPSGNGMMALVWAKLALIYGNPLYQERAQTILTIFSGLFRQDFPSLPFVMMAHQQISNPLSITLVNADAPLIKAAFTADSLACRVIIHERRLDQNGMTAYLCRDHRCLAPVHDAQGLLCLLKGKT